MSRPASCAKRVRLTACSMREQAYKPGSVPGFLQAATISLGRPSPDASSSLPGDAAGRLISPYVTLHQAGFAQVSGCPEPRALLPHDCTLTDGPSESPLRSNQRTTPTGGMFLWHFPWGRPPLGVTQRLALWCPDFPPQAYACSDRPACSRTYRIIRTHGPQTAVLVSGARLTAHRHRRCAPGSVPPAECPSPVSVAPECAR